MNRISRRNFLKAAGVGAAALGLAACGGSSSSTASSVASSTAASSAAAAADVTIKVAAIETGYGADMWKKVAEAFTAQTGIKVDLTTDKKLEDVIGPSMQGGDYPDVVHLATGREAALTEQFIKGNLIADITDVLSMTVPGESKKVSEKIAGGFTDTSLTNPYGDGKTYLAPMFYSPCGLFYNAGFLKEKGWDVPKTWDEMWALGDKAAAEGTYLFTYPTTGYFDAFFYALMYAAGGPEFFNKATHYTEGIWDTPEAKTCFDIVAKLASYTNPITPAQANDQDFTQNQQLVLDNKALFMPNGTWIVGEMAEAPRADGFEWGMTALPAVKAGGDSYSYTWFEQGQGRRRWLQLHLVRAGMDPRRCRASGCRQAVRSLPVQRRSLQAVCRERRYPACAGHRRQSGRRQQDVLLHLRQRRKGRHGQLCSLQCHPRRGSAHRVLRPCQLSGVRQHDRAAVDRRHQVRQRPDARQHHRVIKPCPAGAVFTASAFLGCTVPSRKERSIPYENG